MNCSDKDKYALEYYTYIPTNIYYDRQTFVMIDRLDVMISFCVKFDAFKHV